MHHRSRVFRFLLLPILFLTVKTVAACVCPPNTDDTVLGKFEDARFVVIAKVVAIDETSPGETAHAKMMIEKVYKGNLKVGQQMFFGQGENGSCFDDFDNDDIGSKYLFYLNPKEKTPSVWYADRCGKSKALPGFPSDFVEDAADDLSYLEKMDKVAGKTRLSGTLISYQWSPSHGGADFKKNAATKVRLIGKGKTYETETNEDGVYEIYDLPPGRYKVEPDTPKGWTIDDHSAWGGGASSGKEESEHFELTLKKGRHAYFDFFFKTDTRVRGRVLSPLGLPMKNVCVSLVPTEGTLSEYFKQVDCTDANGSFEIEEIPFGRFFVIVNKDDRISSHQPFRRFYYPNVHEREKASVLTITADHNFEAIDIHVPEMKEVINVEGFFLSADRRPVTKAYVHFKAEKTDELTEGDASAMTDDNGRFSLKVLKGLKGKLFGVVRLDDGEFKQCPQIVVLLKSKQELGWRNQKTDPNEIQTQRNVDNVELRLPFASCKGGKIVSVIRID